MRMIDADELKKELDKTCDFQDLYLPYVFEDLIDNAPTADDWQKFSDELWKNAYERGNQDARPQGKWIFNESDKGLTAVCSECKAVTLSTHGNFCPNCGAAMRGEKHDE